MSSHDINTLILMNESLRSEVAMLNEKLRTKEIAGEFTQDVQKRLKEVLEERDQLKAENMWHKAIIRNDSMFRRSSNEIEKPDKSIEMDDEFQKLSNRI